LSLELEVICDPVRLTQFLPQWSRFVRSQPDATPFQLPEWLITWWSYFGSGALQVFAFRDPEIVGVLPCFLHDWSGRRQLTLIGSGISDYLDPPFEVAHRPAILSALGQHLSVRSDWDVCDWQDLAFNTPLAGLVKNLNGSVLDETPCSEVTLAGDFEEFWQQRPRHLRRNVRRYRQKAEQTGPLEFQVSGSADPELLTALAQLHSARWKSHGETGMIEANHSAAFLRHVASQFAAHEILKIFSLRFRGRIAALILAFIYQNKAYGYLTAFDPVHEQFGFGSILLFEAFRHCYAQGIQSWNFLRGDEPYKALWGAQAIPRLRLTLPRRRS
jgi:CelD/BcsL family acetyltransferase involved in cellulose biosynthesis